MAIDEKALETFLKERASVRDTVPPDILKVLEKIWLHNDTLSGKNDPRYISKTKTLAFLRSQNLPCSKNLLESWASKAGRRSWVNK